MDITHFLHFCKNPSSTISLTHVFCFSSFSPGRYWVSKSVRSLQVMIVFLDILLNILFTNPHTLQHQSELLIFVK